MTIPDVPTKIIWKDFIEGLYVRVLNQLEDEYSYIFIFVTL